MKGCLIVLGILVMVIILVAGTAVLLLPVSPDATPLPEVQVSSEASVDLDKKLGELEQTVSNAETSLTPVPVTLHITEEELTAKAAQLMADDTGFSQLEAKDLQIHLLPDKIVCTAKVRMSGLDLPLTVNSRVEVIDDKPEVVVENVEMGRFPLPAGIQAQIVDTVETQMNEIWTDIPILVEEVRVEQGSAIITGQTKPQ